MKNKLNKSIELAVSKELESHEMPHRFRMKSEEIEEIMAKVEGMNAVQYSKKLGLMIRML